MCVLKVIHEIIILLTIIGRCRKTSPNLERLTGKILKNTTMITIFLATKLQKKQFEILCLKGGLYMHGYIYLFSQNLDP